MKNALFREAISGSLLIVSNSLFNKNNLNTNLKILHSLLRNSFFLRIRLTNMAKITRESKNIFSWKGPTKIIKSNS